MPSRITAALTALAVIACACQSTTSQPGPPAGQAGQAGSAPDSGGGGHAGVVGRAGSGGVGGAAGAGAQGGAALPEAGGSSGAAGASVTSGTWCAEQARPVGVAAGDYACADFDTGIPSKAPWSTVETKENLSLFTDAAKSLPNSLRVNAIAGARGSLVFSAVGGSAVKSVQVSAELNPVPWLAWPGPWEQGARLLCAEVGGARNCLMFEHGDGGDRVYVETTACTVAIPQTCDIPVLPKAGEWTRVELVVSASNVQVAFNGVSVLTKCDSSFCAGTKATASVGLEEPGASGYGVRYDNVQISVNR